MSPAPDPSVIGGVAAPDFARLPDPAALFARRAGRLRALAEDARLGPYLRFLADLAALQAEIAQDLLPAETLRADLIARNRSYRMPPIDRDMLILFGDMTLAMQMMLDRATRIEMPAPAKAALDALRDAPAEDLQTLLGELAADRVPDGFAAPAAFAAAALQVTAARLAATLDASQLVPIRTGVCPTCGGKPAVSIVTATQNQEGARYACCATCATEWNEVRVKCLCCGSTKGIGYRALEADPEKANIRAEICDECHSWVKILYQNRDTALDPMADDIASLGLDAQMRESEWGRGGFNPFLIGY